MKWDRYISATKLVLGFLWVAFGLGLAIIPLLPMLPWRIARIRWTNMMGRWVGLGVVKLVGSQTTVIGRDIAQNTGPAIFVGNHTTSLDAFTSIWLVPPKTVGVAKKEIIYYPVYGQVWALSGHLCLDRQNPIKARASIAKLADLVRRKNLKVLMWPEGTRSKDGRLLPFRKGFAHLALETKLPIIPMVISGAHHAWQKSTWSIRPVPIKIQFLEPISTQDWQRETLDSHIQEVWQKFCDALPPGQQPHSSIQPATHAA